MPTTVVDQAYGGNFDPGVPPPLPASVTVISISLLDENDDGLITANGLDQVNGSLVSAVYNGDTVTIGGVTIQGATIYTADGGRYFTPTDSTILAPGTVTNVGFVTTSTQLTLVGLQPPCFAEGTLITMENGAKTPVEELEVGDLVLTRDNKSQPVRWIGRRKTRGMGLLAPIVFEKGVIGNSRRLAVSPQHRMLLTGWRSELYFGESEVLCAATHLCNDSTIRREEREEIVYFHVLFDRHEIVYAEDTATESFFPGDYICKADRQTYLELVSLFPEMMKERHVSHSIARPILKKQEAALMS